MDTSRNSSEIDGARHHSLAADASPCRIALLYPGDREARNKSSPDQSRFFPLFRALWDMGIHAEPAVYHDDFQAEVREQLAGIDGVLVWINPIQDGCDRSVLDALLRDTAANGVFVSAHPDVIQALGTKEVLYRTRHMGWGCDTEFYRSIAQMQRSLPARLAGGARVLKRLRGHSGNGVWKLEIDAGAGSQASVRVRHAQRGAVEERMSLDAFCRRCAPYFSSDGGMIDQAWQARLPEGMVRCYLVRGEVEGFGLQAVNALYPAAPGAPADSAPSPGPRLYHPPTLPEYQVLKRQLEQQWVPALQRLLDLDDMSLPVLWDCDFLLGPKNAVGEDTYVLCEINASSVAPFPDSAVLPVAQAAVARTHAARTARR